MNFNKKICRHFILTLVFVANFLLVAEAQSKVDHTLPSIGLCAHRGAMETHPENTIPAFVAAVKAGAQMIELDVWLTKDNKMVVIHDATVDRTTNGTGKVIDLTLAEIKKLDAGSWKSSAFEGEHIPTFKEVLQVIPRNVWINVHIKGEDQTPVLAAQLLQKENRLHQAVLACKKDAAKSAKELVPGILICNMERQASNWDYVNETIAMKADFIQLKGEITPEYEDYTKALKKNGIRVNYFGTDSPETLKLLFKYGVDFPLVNDILHSIAYLKDDEVK
jgi:glycerophosphoryl diester phosphodiesterase